MKYKKRGGKVQKNRKEAVMGLRAINAVHLCMKKGVIWEL